MSKLRLRRKKLYSRFSEQSDTKNQRGDTASDGDGLTASRRRRSMLGTNSASYSTDGAPNIPAAVASRPGAHCDTGSPIQGVSMENLGKYNWFFRSVELSSVSSNARATGGRGQGARGVE